VTCLASGQATFRWSNYPGATSYTVNIYSPTGKIPLNAGTATSISTALQGGASYSDWELIISLPDDTKVLDQLEFKCDGTTRGENPVVASTPPAALLTASPTPTPSPSPSSASPSCNSQCATIDENQEGYVCVSDQGEKRWRLPNCTGNSNCNCSATVL
jgi:hypothetical protein